MNIKKTNEDKKKEKTFSQNINFIYSSGNNIKEFHPNSIIKSFIRIMDNICIYIFNYFFFLFILFILQKEVKSDDEQFIELKFKEEGFNQIISDDYKNNLTFEVFINGDPGEINNKFVYINSSENIVKIKFNELLSDFSYMFSNLINITYISMNNIFDIDCNMSYTFNNCENLKTIQFSNSACNANGLIGMFYNCISLTSIKLNIFQTGYIEDMSYMFYNCKNLVDLNISNFDSSLTKNMKSIFHNCESLCSLNLSFFDTTKVEIMWDMFKGCSSLKDLDISNFDTSKVTDMESMFEGCSNLTSLDLNNFNTSNVQYMNKMFSDCKNLELLYFRNISTISLGTMYHMFYNCSSLKYLDIFSLVEDGQSYYEMFEGSSYNFTFCVKEDENIPNIFEELKKGDTNRDCSSSCYGEGINRTSVPNKKLCCPLFEYNDTCYEKCPPRTNNSRGDGICEIFNCTYYYNYKQDGCLESDKIPDGYYLNDTELKTIDKCHENCKTCKGKATELTTNCLLCNESLPYIYFGNCYNSCENGNYIDSEGISRCKCHVKNCKECSEESLELDFCLSCNNEEGFYEKENETIFNSSFVKCYKDPEEYYLDQNLLIYKHCYHTCKSCNQHGNKENHNCLSCNEENKFPIIIGDNSGSSINCYPNCTYNYYFDNESNYICLNDPGCSNDYKFLIDESRECIKSCQEAKEFKYAFRNKCLKICPEDTLPSSNITGNFCYASCDNIERPFLMVETETCVSKCNIMDRYKELCITNYHGDREEEIKDMILSDIREDITDTFNYSFITSDQSVIIHEKNISYEITSTKTLTNDQKISRIDLGECEDVLKKYYGINSEVPLYIFKVDVYVEGKVGPNVEYEIYYPNDNELQLMDLSICEGIDIKVGFPINITEDNIDIYNKDSPFYSDICYTYTNDNGTDIILEDRQNEFTEKNLSLCEEGCSFASYDQETGSATCSCGVKFDLPMASTVSIDKNKLYQFMNIKTIANFKVMKCIKLFFSGKVIATNIGFYFFIPTIIAYFLCLYFFYKRGFNELKYEINKIVFAKRNLKYVLMKLIKKSVFQTYLDKKGINLKLNENRNKENFNNNENIIEKRSHIEGKKYKNGLNLLERNICNEHNETSNDEENNNENNNIIINSLKKISSYENNKQKKIMNPPQNKIKYKINESKIPSTKRYILDNNYSKLTEQKKELIKIFSDKQKQKIIEILSYNNSELNDLSYKKALQYDKRKFFQFYFSLLTSNHLLIRLMDKKDYNSRIIKIFLCFFNFSSVYAINALFFDDSTMHQIYEDGGDFNIIYQLPQIAYSTVISFIIDIIINYLSLSQDDIINLKREKKIASIGKKARKLIKKLKNKFISFFIISFSFILLFWYYLGCFCAVYRNTQYHLIKDTLISFVTGNLYPFAISFIPGLFRIPALSSYSKGKYILYKLSQFIMKFLG